MTGKKPGWRAVGRVDGDGDAKGKMGNETGDRAGTGVRNETGCLPGVKSAWIQAARWGDAVGREGDAVERESRSLKNGWGTKKGSQTAPLCRFD